MTSTSASVQVRKINEDYSSLLVVLSATGITGTTRKIRKINASESKTHK